MTAADLGAKPLALHDFTPAQRVEYRPPYAGAPVLTGTVTLIGARYVFVRFDGDARAKAVAPHCLQHAAEPTPGGAS